MRGNGISRGMGIALAALTVVVAGAFAHSANAQTIASSENCPYWIDAATGERVPTTTIPARLGESAYRNYLNGNRNQASQSGQNFVRQPDGSWIDAATGERVPTTAIPARWGKAHIATTSMAIGTKPTRVDRISFLFPARQHRQLHQPLEAATSVANSPRTGAACDPPKPATQPA
jgi:hypothetical protein